MAGQSLAIKNLLFKIKALSYHHNNWCLDYIAPHASLSTFSLSHFCIKHCLQVLFGLLVLSPLKLDQHTPTWFASSFCQRALIPKMALVNDKATTKKKTAGQNCPWHTFPLSKKKPGFQWKLWSTYVFSLQKPCKSDRAFIKMPFNMKHTVEHSFN